MRHLIAVILCLGFSSTALPAQAIEDVISPHKTFRVSQQQNKDENWVSTLHFTQTKRPDVILSGEYLWSADFHVSPDECWILQVQKSGSGENVSFLYHLEPNGRLWRMEQPFGELAFAFLERSEGIMLADFFHTGISFGAWDSQTDLLHFHISGSSIKNRGKGFARELSYNLKEHNFYAVQ